MSLETLARAVGASNQQISHLETGKRRLTVEWLRRLGKALRCHPWSLVSDDLPAALEPAEIRMLSVFRKLPPEHREALLVLGAAIPRSRASAKGRTRQ
jgi:DNA-binding Xre family transcriptional regulator